MIVVCCWSCNWIKAARVFFGSTPQCRPITQFWSIPSTDWVSFSNFFLWNQNNRFSKKILCTDWVSFENLLFNSSIHNVTRLTHVRLTHGEVAVLRFWWPIDTSLHSCVSTQALNVTLGSGNFMAWSLKVQWDQRNSCSRCDNNDSHYNWHTYGTNCNL